MPASFFHDGDRPLRAEEAGDPFRRGVLIIVHAPSHAELAWLRTIIASLEGEAGTGAG